MKERDKFNINNKKMFVVDQLRKDKIIYAVEACATILVCTLGFLFSNTYFKGVVRSAVNIVLLAIGVGYTIFMGVGNFLRLMKIKKIEEEL